LTTLVLVLATHARPYPRLVKTIKRTWASVPAPGVEILFYYGGRSLKADGPDLQLPVPDDLPNVGRKTIAAFEHVLASRDFDLIFRTNCSSYVDLPNLQEFVRARRPDRGFYCGTVEGHEQIPFASGSGYFLSRDLMELVVREKKSWNHALLDDVALGELLHDHGVEPVPAPRRDYRSPGEVRDVDTSQFHFRCRTDSWRRIDDDRIMLALHAAFARARGLPEPRQDLALRALVTASAVKRLTAAARRRLRAPRRARSARETPSKGARSGSRSRRRA
jgi:hypothetical protein